MKALVCKKLGDPLKDPNVLELINDYPNKKQISPTQVRVKVAGAALNFADVLQVQGLYQEKPKLPFIPGGEVSGQVIEVGQKVKSVKPKDLVFAVSMGGGFSEEIVVEERQVFKLSNVKDLHSAAGLPIAFGTSHLAICERAQLKKGQIILILGAGGGVGIAAVQISKIIGAKVIAVARGSEKKEALQNLGADFVIDSGSQPQRPLRELIKEVAPKGVDVVFDTVGGKHFEESMKCVKWGAQILIIGFASGTIPKISANIALVKNLTVHGIYWGSYMQKSPGILQKGLLQISQWFSEGKISVPSESRYSFEEASEGFRALLERKAIGKVIFLPNAQISKL